MTVSHGHRQLPHCILLEAKTLSFEGASIPGKRERGVSRFCLARSPDTIGVRLGVRSNLCYGVTESPFRLSARNRTVARESVRAKVTEPVVTRRHFAVSFWRVRKFIEPESHEAKTKCRSRCGTQASNMSSSGSGKAVATSAQLSLTRSAKGIRRKCTSPSGFSPTHLTYTTYLLMQQQRN